MSSHLQEILKKLFGTPEYRLLIIGLDASGKTSILYRLKLGTVVQTIPTIGFNVETISYKNTALNIWDVGGCDKIRPLIRHYLQNTQGLICIIDSQDRERLNEMNGHLWSMLMEDEIRDAPLLVYLNKMDLSPVLTREDVIEGLGLNTLRNRSCFLQACSAHTGDGLYEGLDWLVTILKHPRTKTEPILLPQTTPEEETTVTWLSKIDEETDSDFLHLFEKHELSSSTTFDHRTFLRALWTSLKIHGRQETVKHIFNHLKTYLRETNETWIYFWIQIVHYAMMTMSMQADDFMHFLIMNPQLLNETDLPLTYYKRETIFSDEAKKQFVLPDRKPLPSIVPTNNATTSTSRAPERPVDVIIEDDDEFLKQFEACTLTNWSHKTHLRMAWLYLTRDGRRIGVKKIFDGIKNFIDKSPVARKTTFHFTMTYFWIQMIDLAIAQSPSNITFEEFLRINPHLMNGGLFLEYYKKETMLNNPIARQEMVLPDIKPLPTLVASSTRK